MARGNYIRERSQPLAPELRTAAVPARATRRLTLDLEDIEREAGIETLTQTTESPRAVTVDTAPHKPVPAPVVDAIQPRSRPVKRHRHLSPFILTTVCAVLFLAVVLSAALYQRSGGPRLLNLPGGQVYDIQVGGDLAASWQKDEPLPTQDIPKDTGPHSVLGEPTVSPAFIDQVLAAYGSPAAGKGKVLYELGVKYRIDPVYALAFFMHESTFGTKGVAVESLSLGNLRCIPNHRCVNNYTYFDSWEDGFKAWYELIRNLYIAQWGLVTVTQIIPTYAPAADNNNEEAYINSVHRAVDKWRAGIIMV